MRLFLRCRSWVMLGFIGSLTLLPLQACANGLIPAVNAFRPTPVFGFVFPAVVVLETICLQLWFRNRHYASVLGRVLLFNAVSSLAGYLLMRSPFHPEFTSVWQQAIPFFFLTMVVEWPLVCLLFRKALRSWKQALLCIGFANVMSYAFLIAVEGPAEQVWLNHLGALDRQVLARWTDFPMLAEASGRIYAGSDPGGPGHRLRYFSFSDNQWHSMTNCPAIDPRDWDVRGDLVAFKTYPESPSHTVKLARLPAFSLVHEIPIVRAAHAAEGAWAIRISPDQTKLALLIWQHEVRVPLSGSGYQVPARTYLLTVFDTASGRTLATCPRKAVSGLCWLPDSKTILFHSLRDERLHQLPTIQDGWDAPHAVSKPDPAFNDRPVYAYDVEAGSVRLFGEMATMHLAQEAKLLAWTSSDDTVTLRALETDATTSVQVGLLGGEIEISPDGRFLIAPLKLSHPLGHPGHPTIVDLQNPSRRHYLGWDYRFVWTEQR